MISDEDVIRIAIQQSNKHAVERIVGHDFLLRFARALISESQNHAMHPELPDIYRWAEQSELAEHVWLGVEQRKHEHDAVVKFAELARADLVEEIHDLNQKLHTAHENQLTMAGWLRKWCKFDCLNMNLTEWQDFCAAHGEFMQNNPDLKAEHAS